MMKRAMPTAVYDEICGPTHVSSSMGCGARWDFYGHRMHQKPCHQQERRNADQSLELPITRTHRTKRALDIRRCVIKPDLWMQVEAEENHTTHQDGEQG